MSVPLDEFRANVYSQTVSALLGPEGVLLFFGTDGLDSS